MNKAIGVFAVVLAASQVSCVQSDPITKALNSRAKPISMVTDNLATHEVQVLLSEIVHEADGGISFKDAQFQLNKNNYFYPASTVKFPVALLALEKLAEDKRVNRNTPFRLEGDEEETTFAKEITELFVVSDNEAYNRLFEYLGKDEINRRLAAKGIVGRLSHRLSVPNSDLLTYKPLHFLLSQGEIITQAETSKPITVPSLAKLSKGTAFQQDGHIINEPFNFAEKNYLPIESLHSIMQRLLFPEQFKPSERFQLTSDDRHFLLNTMKMLPSEAGFTGEDYYDSYVKFFVVGDTKAPMPGHLEIANKVGYAYGTLTDCAYIFDKKNNREYIITATLLVNDNRTFNDDNYEYESVGIPFLAELGRQLIGY